MKGIVSGDNAGWRYMFLTGLLAGGAALRIWYPSAFDPASVLGALPLSRLVTAGELRLMVLQMVGVGERSWAHV